MLAFCLLPERRQGEWRTHEPITQTHGLSVCSSPCPGGKAISSTYGVAGSLRIIPEEPTGAHLRKGNVSQMLSNLLLEAKEALSGYCVPCERSDPATTPYVQKPASERPVLILSDLSPAVSVGRCVQREGCFQNLFSVSQSDKCE